MPSPELPSARESAWVRVDTWLGAVPLAGFLIAHLVLQASALWGPRAYAALAGSEWSAAWRALEVACIYLPLAAHVLLGVYRALKHGSAGDSVRDGGPGGRALALASTVVLLVFLIAHLAELPYRRWVGLIVPSDFYPELCARLSSTVYGGVPAVALGYLLGVAAAALHGAQGLYRAGLRLGWIGAERQRPWGGVCGALGVGLFALGALIVIDLATG